MCVRGVIATSAEYMTDWYMCEMDGKMASASLVPMINDINNSVDTNYIHSAQMRLPL